MFFVFICWKYYTLETKYIFKICDDITAAYVFCIWKHLLDSKEIVCVEIREERKKNNREKAKLKKYMRRRWVYSFDQYHHMQCSGKMYFCVFRFFFFSYLKNICMENSFTIYVKYSCSFPIVCRITGYESCRYVLKAFHFFYVYYSFLAAAAQQLMMCRKATFWVTYESFVCGFFFSSSKGQVGLGLFE